MFTNKGEMRLATNKSTLKNKLKVEITGRSAPKANIVFVDGSAILWAIYWTTERKVKYFIENVGSCNTQDEKGWCVPDN